MVGRQRIEATTERRVLLAGRAAGDEGRVIRALVAQLRAEGYRVARAVDPRANRSVGVGAGLDLVVTLDAGEFHADLARDLAEASARHEGFALVRWFRGRSDVPIIVVSEADSIAACEAAMGAGADRFLPQARALVDLGSVARGLVEGRRARSMDRRRPLMTAREARGLRERELFEELERLVVETRGNIAEIARRVGRDRSTVRYHLKRFGMLDAARRSQGAPRAPR